MKKMNNKGFSLVELIIVIAIMAILAGAIAPALIRYIDKSRKSNDVSAAKTFKTAVETAMSKELTYELLTAAKATPDTITDADGASITYAGVVKAEPGQSTDAANAATAITISHNVANPETNQVSDAEKEIAANIGENVPKAKYKKDAKQAADGGAAYLAGSSAEWYAYISSGGTVVAGLGNGTAFYQLAPDVSKYYQ